MTKEESGGNGEKQTYEAEKCYFAFISYTRSDLAAAQYVQRTLEHFRYPKDSIRPEYYPDDDKYVREIFLDKTELSGRGALFERRLEAALANSRYLIVICSPRSAQKKLGPNERHYVEWEIQTFLKKLKVSDKYFKSVKYKDSEDGISYTFAIVPSALGRNEKTRIKNLPVYDPTPES